MTSKFCNDTGAVEFVKKYIEDCRKLTADIGISGEYILALAASETSYGRAGSFVQYNNFFSMETKSKNPNIKYAIGYVIAEKTKNDLNPVQVAKFSSFYDCAHSFVDGYATAIKGATTPQEFANKLIKAGFNTANAKTNGDPNFAPKLVQTIHAVQERLKCP